VLRAYGHAMFGFEFWSILSVFRGKYIIESTIIPIRVVRSQIFLVVHNSMSGCVSCNLTPSSYKTGTFIFLVIPLPIVPLFFLFSLYIPESFFAAFFSRNIILHKFELIFGKRVPSV